MQQSIRPIDNANTDTVKMQTTLEGLHLKYVRFYESAAIF